MIIITNTRQILDEDWELLEVQDARKEEDNTVYQELWINKWTHDQEIIERRLQNGAA